MRGRDSSEWGREKLQESTREGNYYHHRFSSSKTNNGRDRIVLQTKGIRTKRIDDVVDDDDDDDDDGDGEMRYTQKKEAH